MQRKAFDWLVVISFGDPCCLIAKEQTIRPTAIHEPYSEVRDPRWTMNYAAWYEANEVHEVTRLQKLTESYET